jgi:hypothetical protein
MEVEAKLDMTRSTFSEPHFGQMMLVSDWEKTNTSNFSPHL